MLNKSMLAPEIQNGKSTKATKKDGCSEAQSRPLWQWRKTAPRDLMVLVSCTASLCCIFALPFLLHCVDKLCCSALCWLCYFLLLCRVVERSVVARTGTPVRRCLAWLSGHDQTPLESPSGGDHSATEDNNSEIITRITTEK